MAAPRAEANDAARRDAGAEGGARSLPPLATFLQAGRAQGLGVREARAIASQRDLEEEGAWLDLVPSLSATGSYRRNEVESAISIPDASGTTREVVITPLDQLDAEIRIDATLLDVPTLVRIGTASARARAAERSVASAAVESDRAVALAYFDRVAAEGVERAADRAREVAARDRGVTEARLQAGLASDLDLARAQAEVDRRGRTVVEARQARASAERRLRTLTRLDATGRAPDLVDGGAIPPPIDSTVSARAGLPAVAAAEAEAEAAADAETAARSAFAPTVAAFASERFTNAAGFGQSPVWSVGVTASWVLDPSTLANARVQAAAAEVAAVKKERADRDASDTALDAREEVLARIAENASALSSREAARRAVSTARARFEAGTATQLDLLIAERDALQAEVDAIQSGARLALARALLDLAVRGEVAR